MHHTFFYVPTKKLRALCYNKFCGHHSSGSKLWLQYTSMDKYLQLIEA